MHLRIPLFPSPVLKTMALSAIFVSIQAPRAEARQLKVGTTDFPTIQGAVNAARAGDVILVPPRAEPYHESVTFNNRSGSEGEPIILDGQGATLAGGEILKAEEWQEVSPDLYRSTALPARIKMEPAILMRYFFIFDGKINRMGHASKSMDVPYKTSQALQADEWTYVAAERAFYVRLRPGRKLETVRVPILAAGVSVMGSCEHLKIRNLTVKNFWNDGFNFHDRSRDISLSNIRALDCGDDGVSAHEDCQIDVDGLVSKGNATGFCHIGNSRTRSRNVYIANCASYGIFLLDSSHHELENCVIQSDSGYALRLLKGTELDMKNVLIAGSANQQMGLAIESASQLTARNVSVWQLPFAVKQSHVNWSNSVSAGTANGVSIDVDSEWQGDGNLWDVDSIQWKGVSINRNSGLPFHFANQEITSFGQPLKREDVLKGSFIPCGFDSGQVLWYRTGEPYTE